MWTLKHSSLFSLAGWRHKERTLSRQAKSKSLPLGKCSYLKSIVSFSELSSYQYIRNAHIGYWVGLCVGKDSKANYDLKGIKECYEWSLISAKDFRGKPMGHTCDWCVFAILGLRLHLILNTYCFRCITTYHFTYIGNSHSSPWSFLWAECKTEFSSYGLCFSKWGKFSLCDVFSASNIPNKECLTEENKKAWNKRIVPASELRDEKDHLWLCYLNVVGRSAASDLIIRSALD